MYPNFITQNEQNSYSHTRTFVISGQPYVASPLDSYIDEAISLAGNWLPHQRSLARIMHLRDWLRENDQHAHNIPYEHIKDMQDCKCFIDNVIQAEYAGVGKHGREGFNASLRENERIFFD